MWGSDGQEWCQCQRHGFLLHDAIVSHIYVHIHRYVYVSLRSFLFSLYTFLFIAGYTFSFLSCGMCFSLDHHVLMRIFLCCLSVISCGSWTTLLFFSCRFSCLLLYIQSCLFSFQPVFLIINFFCPCLTRINVVAISHLSLSTVRLISSFEIHRSFSIQESLQIVIGTRTFSRLQDFRIPYIENLTKVQFCILEESQHITGCTKAYN